MTDTPFKRNTKRPRSTQLQDAIDASRGMGELLETAVTRAEFDNACAELERRIGLQLRVQPDPMGRTVSHGFHVHRPDADGRCHGWIVYGWATEMAALLAGVLALLDACCADGAVPHPAGPDVGRHRERCDDGA